MRSYVHSCINLHSSPIFICLLPDPSRPLAPWAHIIQIVSISDCTHWSGSVGAVTSVMNDIDERPFSFFTELAHQRKTQFSITVPGDSEIALPCERLLVEFRVSHYSASYAVYIAARKYTNSHPGITQSLPSLFGDRYNVRRCDVYPGSILPLTISLS